MPYLNSVADRFQGAAFFVFVYISEAHAKDEWPINQLEKEILRHQTLEDRRAAAVGLLEAFPLHPAFQVVLDSMEDAFNNAFASWPFRFWAIVNGRVALKPQPREATYNLRELGGWLEEHCGKKAAC